MKWFLWHGNLFRALQVIEDLIDDLEITHSIDDADPQPSKLLKLLQEFDTYLRANAGSIPNYGERYRAGEAITSAAAESAVNLLVSKRMVKKQQMRWTAQAAHLLLQLRTRVLNRELADAFRRWYPNFADAPDRHVLAA